MSSIRCALSGAGFDFVIDCIDSFRIKAALIAACRRSKIPLITVGGAGGQTDPTRIRLTDLSRTEQDPLLSKTRKLLRREYGFSSNPKRRFDVPAVYSTEQQVYPTAEGAVCMDKPTALEGSLNCGGFGSAMTVTATFGMAAVSHLLKRLAEKVQ
jgi:tRNA A37 threonylcarbamoyladenosine dehydratase